MINTFVMRNSKNTAKIPLAQVILCILNIQSTLYNNIHEHTLNHKFD